MALGSGIAERPRRGDLRTRIMIEVLHQGGTMDDVTTKQRELRYKKVHELQTYYKNLLSGRKKNV